MSLASFCYVSKVSLFSVLTAQGHNVRHASPIVPARNFPQIPGSDHVVCPKVHFALHAPAMPGPHASLYTHTTLHPCTKNASAFPSPLPQAPPINKSTNPRKGRWGREHNACPRRHTAVNCAPPHWRTRPVPKQQQQKSRWHQSGNEKRHDDVLEPYELSPYVLSPKLTVRKIKRDTNGALCRCHRPTAGTVSRLPPHFTSRLLPLCP